VIDMRVFASLLLAALLCTAAPPPARGEEWVIPPSGVIGVGDTQLSPGFWIERAASPHAVLMTRAAIAAQNAKVQARDPSMHDLRALPATLPGDQVKGWIAELSELPDHPLYDVHGNEVPAATLEAWQRALALDAIPAQQETRYGLVVQRTDLRTFPTAERVFSGRGGTDIDRFQESGIFPGTPVAVAHQSGDGQWLFVVSPRYAAWVRSDAVAFGDRQAVFDYADAAPYRVVTGASVQTVFTPEQPRVSQKELDMGVRVPLATSLRADAPVNGQTAYTSHVVQLPVRNDDGSLQVVPALLQRNADSAGDYLPLTRANILGQAFKFLGERYGWGHAYDGRDCSGFVSEVYRSMGVLMPRNTSDQAVSPGLDHIAFDKQSSRAQRMRAIAALDVGDLVYIPGHVMMVIGKLDGMHYVIHDTTGISYAKPDGSRARVKLNAVSVTPLEPLMFNETQSYIDRMTSIVRIHPGAATP
jgi:hypothetical protein